MDAPWSRAWPVRLCTLWSKDSRVLAGELGALVVLLPGRRFSSCGGGGGGPDGGGRPPPPLVGGAGTGLPPVAPGWRLIYGSITFKNKLNEAFFWRKVLFSYFFWWISSGCCWWLSNWWIFTLRGQIPGAKSTFQVIDITCK